MVVANILAYYDTTTITAVKSFVEQAIHFHFSLIFIVKARAYQSGAP